NRTNAVLFGSHAGSNRGGPGASNPDSGLTPALDAEIIFNGAAGMETVLVTGGTGHLGCDLVRQLAAGHRKLRVLARSPGRDPRVEWAIGDLATGEGIAAALQGVDKVINAATLSPIARRGSISPVDFFRPPRSLDVDGTRRLLEASQRARVAHLLHVSIAGLADSSLPCSRVTLT